MVKEFNSLEEIQKYYNKKTNTYIFKEDDEYIDLVVFNFDLNIHSDINVYDIKARNINAWNIKSRNIDAWDISACNINACNINAGNINACDINAVDIEALDIKARDINYDIICCAYKNIKCKSINGRRKNSWHFVLDGKIEIKDE